jgi:hypothetical protein
MAHAVRTGHDTAASARQRLAEVAALLAAGILRLRSRKATEPVLPAEQVRLDFASRQSVDADAEPEKEFAP